MTTIAAPRPSARLTQEPLGEDVEFCGSDWRRVVCWHDATRLGTAAFWIDQARRRPRPETYQIGSGLHQEVALCLLGGYGITEKMAYSAYKRLRDEQLLTGEPVDADVLREALSRPFDLPGHPRPVRYRFPSLKADRLAGALAYLREHSPPPTAEPVELRDWLTSLPGIGLKTASWVVRNVTRTNDVAVIDVHIRRAGIAAGVFDPAWKLPRDYHRFEEAFVTWARVGGVPTADLDACIWSTLARMGRGARLMFGVVSLGDLD